MTLKSINLGAVSTPTSVLVGHLLGPQLEDKTLVQLKTKKNQLIECALLVNKDSILTK